MNLLYCLLFHYYYFFFPLVRWNEIEETGCDKKWDVKSKICFLIFGIIEVENLSYIRRLVNGWRELKLVRIYEIRRKLEIK